MYYVYTINSFYNLCPTNSFYSVDKTVVCLFVNCLFINWLNSLIKHCIEYLTRKATGFKSLRNCQEINKVTPKWQLNFSDKTCKKSSKIEKEQNIEFYIFKKSTYQMSAKIYNFRNLDQMNSKKVFPIIEFYIFQLV